MLLCIDSFSVLKGFCEIWIILLIVRCSWHNWNTGQLDWPICKSKKRKNQAVSTNWRSVTLLSSLNTLIKFIIFQIFRLVDQRSVTKLLIYFLSSTENFTDYSMINQDFRFIGKYRLCRLLTLLLIQMFLPSYWWFNLLVCTSFIQIKILLICTRKHFKKTTWNTILLPYRQILLTGNLKVFSFHLSFN